MPTIYALKDPETGAVRYIGKANDVTKRVRQHVREARASKFQNRKVRWLRSLGRPPVVEILEVVADGDSWGDRERFWIKTFRDAGADLTNFLDGGEVNAWEGKKHSPETVARLRELALERGAMPPSRRGIKTSEETRQKLRQAMLANGNKPPVGAHKGHFKAKCKAGHERNAKNSYYSNGRYKYCRICQADSCREFQKQKRLVRASS